MEKLTKISKSCLLILCMSSLLVACQSTNTAKKTPERPLNVIKTSDRIQNIAWKIRSIDGKPAQFFFQQPNLQFNAHSQRLQGNTGCNALFGEYRLNTQTQVLTIWARADYQSCDHALPQEAYLMQSLGEVKRYQLVTNTLHLLDQQGKSVVVLQR
jgi:heat shock protein HslJ